MRVKWERTYRLEETVHWIGLEESDIRPYQSYVNQKSPGVCGTYCAAVLTSIVAHQQHIDSPNMEELLEWFEPRIERLLPYSGTFGWDVAIGLRFFWKRYGFSVSSSLFSERIVKQMVANKQPVIVGTKRILGSPYGNHWLLVYAYAEDSKGRLWFKAYDNHGKIDAILPAVQTFGAVYLVEQSTGQNKRQGAKM